MITVTATYNPVMPSKGSADYWNILPPVTIPQERRLDHVRACSDFASGLLNRHPRWIETVERPEPPDAGELTARIQEHGLESGLRRFRNREMLRIVWRDLCGIAALAAASSTCRPTST